MNQQTEFFPESIYDYGEFFLIEGLDEPSGQPLYVALACVGDWPKYLSEYIQKYETQLSFPPNKRGLDIFQRIYGSATELRTEGWLIVYPEGCTPLLALNYQARTLPQRSKVKVVKATPKPIGWDIEL